jgi:hypothetical protein
LSHNAIRDQTELDAAYMNGVRRITCCGVLEMLGVMRGALSLTTRRGGTLVAPRVARSDDDSSPPMRIQQKLSNPKTAGRAQ